MKHWMIVLTAALLLLAVLPAEDTSAAPSGKAYNNYLEKLNWTEEDMEAYLGDGTFHSMNLIR